MVKLCRKIKAVIKGVPEGYQIPALPSWDGEWSSQSQSFVQNNGTNLEQHQEFMHWYCGFLLRELRPTASYQSHITALSILHHLLESDPSLFDNRMSRGSRQYTSGPYQCTWELLSRLLIDLLFDPFDDVRQVSAATLESLLHRQLELQKEASDGADTKPSHGSNRDFQPIMGLITSGTRAARALSRQSGRADQADGLGRLLYLSYCADELSSATDCRRGSFEELESELGRVVRNAGSNLDDAIRCAPIHGLLMALR